MNRTTLKLPAAAFCRKRQPSGKLGPTWHPINYKFLASNWREIEENGKNNRKSGTPSPYYEDLGNSEAYNCRFAHKTKLIRLLF